MMPEGRCGGRSGLGPGRTEDNGQPVFSDYVEYQCTDGHHILYLKEYSFSPI